MKVDMPSSGCEHEPEGFDSLNCLNVFIEDAGDRTVEPASPEWRARLTAESERVALLMEKDKPLGKGISENGPT